MVSSIQQSGRWSLRAGQASIAAMVLALAGCAQPGATGQGATGGPGLRLPVIQWPLGQGTAANQSAAAGATGGTARVTDPFAGQGVAQPTVPPTGGAKAATTTPARSHTVVSGETGWSVARKYGVSVKDLAAANNMAETANLRIGQTLIIPATTSSSANVVSAPGVGSPTPTPPSASQPLPNEQTTPASAPAPKSEAPDLGATRTSASGNGKFAMPANGSIVRTYKKGSNDGIDISAAPGSQVSAAGGGTVAAVTRDTDGVPIVVVRHDDGLMTVYAGIDKLSVSKGDSVKRGQSIGTARSNGVLHFEVRNGFDSVNPEDYL